MNFRKNDIDHIHPKAILSRRNIELTRINDVANFQLLDFSSNRSKNDRELYEWINSLPLENKSTYIKTHLIPVNEKLWYSRRYRTFLKERKNLIIEKLNEELNKKI